MLSTDDQANAQQITDNFHRLYYEGYESTWEQTYWMGVKILKCPFDLWVYQEILWSQKPDVVVETGTAHGGSALWFADMLDILGHGQVVSIDVCGEETFPNRPGRPRIRYMKGSSTGEKIVNELHTLYHDMNVLVVLDSAHDADHVYSELQMYHRLIPVGGYLIVEDSNVHGHPVATDHPPGPFEAVERWLPEHPEFEIDASCEKFRFTFNPHGYLRRVR